MKARTCPNCKYRYSIAEYLKVFLKLQDSLFYCKNCGTALTFGFGRRIVVALIAMLPIALGEEFASYNNSQFGLPIWAGYGLFVPVFLLWAMLMFSLDSFKEV